MNSDNPLNWQTGSSIGRGLLAAPLGVVLTIGFFMALSQLTTPGQVIEERRFDSPRLALLLAQRDSELQLRDRRPPPPPEPRTRPRIFEPELPRPREPDSVDIAVETADSPSIDFDLDIEIELQIPDLQLATLEARPDEGISLVRNNPRILKNVLPRYPSRAQRRKIEGSLVAEFVIGADGYADPESIEFTEADPEGVFEQAVLRSIRRSRFEPLLIDGKAVQYRARKQYKFVMPK